MKFEEYRPEANAGPKYTEFEYIDTFRADLTNVTFLAKVKSSDQELVVKFVGRYGVEAHQLLADAGMAPRLLYCGLMDGKSDVRNAGSCAQGSIKRGGLYVGLMRMVVMEHTMERLQISRPGQKMPAKRPRRQSRNYTMLNLSSGTCEDPMLCFQGSTFF